MRHASDQVIHARRGRSLEGVKILELAWVMAGPISGRYLADNGATVIRVESMTRPDVMRLSEPYKDGIPGVNRSGVFAFYAANKYSLALNLSHPRAREVVHRLIWWSDIVTENFAPGKLEGLGLDYNEMKKIKKDIILVRISIQGQTGPHSRHPGYGVTAAGLAGITGLTGWPDRVPSTPVAGYTDIILPRFAAAMMIAALDYRRRTGKGQCIDINQLEVTQQFLAPVILDYTVNGRDTVRQGNTCPYAVPHNAYPCRGQDRWCVISVSTDDEWLALCRAMGKADLANKDGYRTLLDRKRNEKQIDEWVSSWTADKMAEEVMTELQKFGVPAGVVQNAHDLLQDHGLERVLWRLEHSEIGTLHHLGQAFTLSGVDGEPCAPAPCLGEHTEFICTNILGMSDEEFVDLLSAGVFE